MPSLAIIGAGPAGVMAAISAAHAAAGSPAAAGLVDLSVDLLDAGVPLATILRTGGGRCNIANTLSDKQALASQYPRGGKFLFSAFARFGPREIAAWFVSRGCPLAEEDGGRLFPRTGRAETVRDLLAEEARRLGVRVRAQAAVSAVERSAAGFTVTTARGTESFDRLVIATGGACHGLARGLGHTVTPLAPSLAALVTREAWPGSLAGLTLPQARCAARFDGKKAAVETGDLLFTHRGITGPLAFRISARCAYLPFSASRPLELRLSALPGRSAAEIEAAVQEAVSRSPNQRVTAALRGLVPRSLAEAVGELAGIDPLLPCNQLDREARRAIARLLDGLPLAVTATEKGAEMVTAGGVALDEVDPRTMESRLAPGLFFCGEVLDIDGFTGGFNLMAAWATGRCAGLASVQNPPLAGLASVR
jgi:predicted Rossmann fold flavoprotein